MGKLHLQVEDMTSLSQAMKDREITMKAKAVLAYACVMGDGGTISSEKLMEDMGEGGKSIRNAIKSLEDAGYLERTQDLGTGSFTWDWHLSVPKREGK